MRPLDLPLLAVLAAASLPSDAAAQLMASEAASVSQTVDGTKITVEYSRPRARGRRGLFGTRIHVGEVWTPGANAATTLALSRDVTIEGRAVPKGKYSVWIVTAPGQWELLLDPDTARFHTQRPKPRDGQHRIPIRRETRPFMEVLTWWFPEVGSSGVTLAMQWDTVQVPLRVGVTSSFSRAIAPDVARRIVGRYRMVSEPMPKPSGEEEAGQEEDEPAPVVELTLRYEGNELRGSMHPPLFSSEPGYTDWIVVPGKGDWFKLGRLDGGELIEIFDFAALRFEPAGERATRFELRATNDMLLAKGTRLP